MADHDDVHLKRFSYAAAVDGELDVGVQTVGTNLTLIYSADRDKLRTLLPRRSMIVTTIID